ncbi:hypothetical protein [Palleronia caenipelagi]|uniref:Uncharacterized protein n=1 Tax=Palleronia caenipelagi TaxID=2489174 RepID=A0A547PNF3_9RHOB|nr:hypothetical protein [Palleronia caenipelagi]TRD15574.1 hypothetical protein FEV53_15935 [Palleronia caenipelagi]
MSDLWENTEHPIVTWVNSGENWLSKQIEPINQRLLVVEIAAAILGPHPGEIAGIAGAYPLEIKPESDVVKVRFFDFVSYSVTEEMFAQQSDQETSSGSWLRVFSNSFFLDFVAQSTWATSDFPGKLTHYQINTLDHTINVVTLNPPEILKVASDTR